MNRYSYIPFICIILISVIGNMHAQEDSGLPRFQAGFTLNYNTPQGFVKEFIGEGFFGFGYNLNYRIKENSSLLMGAELIFSSYDKRYIENKRMSSVDLDVEVKPAIVNFNVYGKYELLSTYYLIPYVKAGLGMYFYRTSFTDYDPQTGGQYSTYSENKDFAALGKAGLGVGIPILSPILLEVEVNYTKTSPLEYDYLDRNINGVEAFPIDFYNFTKSSQDFLTFDFRIIVEFSE